VSTGSPQVHDAWGVAHRSRTYGGFVDAVCDKAFVVPCWISLLHIASTAGYFRWIQYFVLNTLILLEVSSACIRFRAYYTSTGVAAPKVEGFDFSTSAVKADHVGKAKQTFEMMGTALYILPFTTYLGLALLSLAVPLAYESVRRKVKKRVIYVQAGETYDHKTLKFWMQAKGLGSKLIVGVADAKNTDMVLNALGTACVDAVIAEAPAKADLMFLEEHDIDYVLSKASQTQFVTDEVLHTKCSLVVGDDMIVRPLLAKTEHKD
jgi:phosphatidylglycerophosphate synthase